MWKPRKRVGQEKLYLLNFFVVDVSSFIFSPYFWSILVLCCFFFLFFFLCGHYLPLLLLFAFYAHDFYGCCISNKLKQKKLFKKNTIFLKKLLKALNQLLFSLKSSTIYIWQGPKLSLWQLTQDFLLSIDDIILLWIISLQNNFPRYFIKLSATSILVANLKLDVCNFPKMGPGIFSFHMHSSINL